MNVSLRSLVFFLLLLFFSSPVFSQVKSLAGQNLSTVNVDDLSDEDIKTYYLKAIDNGLTEQDMYKILQERGMTMDEINKLTDRIAKINPQADSKSKSKDTKEDDKTTADKDKDKDSKDEKKTSRYDEKDASKAQVQPVVQDLSIFGSELFATNSLVFEPNLRIPTPAGYLLGPDDELLINVFGYSEKTYNLTVNEEGNIYIPQVGPIYVNGLHIEEASARIKAKLASTIYKAINSGQTSVQVSLGKIRSIRVTVIGEAKKPGTLTVSSLTTLFNALYLCGGPSDFGSYRKIELIRGNQLKRTVDLYAFLTHGDQKDNALLQEGDVIRIPYYKTRVLLYGSVKRKGKYELIDGENFESVLQFSGGFADDAYKSAVTVYQLTETERRIVDIIKSQYGNYKPQSSDSIVVGKLLNRFENKLSIKGAVMRPGDYELSDGITIKQLLEKAGGVKEDVYSPRGIIKRLGLNNEPTQLSFDIDSVIKGRSTIPLKKNDEVVVYSIFDLKNPNEVIIDGFVNKPGKYKLAENMTLQDLVLAAGGFSELGDNGNIEIARRIDEINLTETNHLQTEIISVDLSANANDRDIVLKPFDVVNIRQKAGYTSQRTVFVEGRVIHPGRYTLQMSGDRISDVMKRTGGLRSNADSSAVVLRRLVKKNQSVEERQRLYSKLLNIRRDSLDSIEPIKRELFKDYDNVSVDLLKAMHNPQSPEDLLLEDGDVITVEQNTNLVKVSGEVYFPTITPFIKNENLKYYIQKSGSYTDQARKSETFIIYPDGKAKKVKRFLFFKSYPEVVSRSEIFVPRKSDKNKSRFSIGEWSVLLSSLAIIANVILNFKK